MGDYLATQTTPLDKYRKACSLADRLIETLLPLVWADEEEELARQRMKAVERDLDVEPQTLVHPLRVGAFIGPLMGVSERTLAEQIESRTRPRKSRRWSAARDVERLSACGSDFIGFAPTCCGGETQVIPINCNHRMCPRCNFQKAAGYREKVMGLFHTFDNPQLLTLTVPSPKFMSREVLDRLNNRTKAFLKEHKWLLKGGVRSTEITYNDKAQTWHPHVHILVDVDLPAKRMEYWAFCQLKWHLEFDWLVMTQGKKKRWKHDDFWLWLQTVRPWVRGNTAKHGSVSDRRVVDIRPVTKDKKAAYEVLKYMSKAATFVGHPSALKQLLVAIRGVRQIQTFGSAYGFKIEEPEPKEGHLACEAHLKCGCGKNEFESIGRLGMAMVNMSPEGTWYVRKDAPVRERQRCRGSST